MNENLVRQFAVRARSLAHYETGDRFPPSVYYNFLRVAVNSIDAKVAVELGVCGGGGSYYMARSTPKCDVIGVDHTLEYPKNIDFIERSCPNFTFIQGDSIDVIEEIALNISTIDLLFIDTTHEYEQTKIEFETYLPLMTASEKALICMDDLNRDGTRKYWNEIEYPKVEIPVLHIGGSPSDGSFGIVWGLE